MDKWIKCSDKMPKIGIGNDYLFVNGKGDVTMGYAFSIEDERRVWINDMANETNEIATHWQELPKPPRSEDELV